MKLFNLFKKEDPQQWEMTNEDWKLLAQMYFRYLNRDQDIQQIVNKTDYIDKAYLYNATVYSIIALRAIAARGIPWLVYKIKSKQKLRQYQGITSKDLDLRKTLKLKEQALEEIDKGPINRLLKYPHPMMTFADIIEGLFSYRDITGDSYLYKVFGKEKEIIQFHLLPGDKTKIVAGSYLNPIKGFRFDGISGDILPPERVIHWRYFNPKWDTDGKQLYGMSPLVAATRLINSDNAGINSETASFANEGVKAIITGTVSSDVEFTKEQADNLMRKWKRAITRAREGDGNIFAQRAPVEVHKIGETPVDLGVLTSRKYNKEILCNIFRIHPALLSSDASTLDNLKEARKGLMTTSVMPDMDSLRDLLNIHIQGSFGEEYFIDYDIMAIGELQDDIEKLTKSISVMDWITIDEKRAMTNYGDFIPDSSNPARMLFTDMSKVPLGYGMDSSLDDIDNQLEKLRQ